jgi:hypothetical protein
MFGAQSRACLLLDKEYLTPLQAAKSTFSVVAG